MLRFVSSSDHISFRVIKKTHYNFLKANDYIECFDSMHNAIYSQLIKLEISEVKQKIHLAKSIDIPERPMNQTMLSWFIVFYTVTFGFVLNKYPVVYFYIIALVVSSALVIDLTLRASGRERSSNRTYFKLVTEIAEDVLAIKKNNEKDLNV